MKNVFFTYISSEFDKESAKLFKEKGWKVYYGKGEFEEAEKINFENEIKIDKLELFIDTARYICEEDKKNIRDNLSREELLKSFEYNYLEPIKMLEKLIPFMDKAESNEDEVGRRLVFINTAESSMNWNSNNNGFGYSVARAAMNNTVSTFFNKLYPLGYTFRMYDPMFDNVNPKTAAFGLYGYVNIGRCDDDGDPRCQDERRVVIRDALGREIPW